MAHPNVRVANVAGFNIPEFDKVELTYSANNITGALFSQGSQIVAELQMTYEDPNVNDSNLVSVERTQ
jgi:hypothetical protein